MKPWKRIRQWLLRRLIATSGADGVSQVIQQAIGRYQVLYPQRDFYFLTLPRGEGRADELSRITEFLKNHQNDQ